MSLFRTLWATPESKKRKIRLGWLNKMSQNVKESCFFQESERKGRFVTYITTVTASVTSTVTATTTALPISTIFFTSIAGAASQCFPAGLMAGAGIQQCP